MNTSNQAKKSLVDFVARLPGLNLHPKVEPLQLPQPPFVLRVAVGGHLWVPDPEPLKAVMRSVLSGLLEYSQRTKGLFSTALGDESTDSDQLPEVRILCQLAPGVDQLAAEIAVDLEYQLHVVLPAYREVFERDFVRQMGERYNGRTNFDSVRMAESYWNLLSEATRVLELDSPSASDELGTESYAQATSLILAHSDIVVVAIHEESGDQAGGTRWMEQQSEDLDLPVVRVPIDNPTEAVLIWTNDGRRESRSLFDRSKRSFSSIVFDQALNGALLPAADTSNPFRNGWFDSRLLQRLDWNLNSQFWDQRWQLPEAATNLAQHSLGSVIKQIDSDLKLVKVWADHRASTMANIVRGSYIVCSLLGGLAVLSALAGLLYGGLGKPGKMVELLCLVIILIFIWRSTKWKWRAQWLSLRQFERSIEQSAWLLTLGRTISLTIPAHEHKFQDDQHGNWLRWYRFAVLRKATFPNARLDADYINTVQELALKNLIRNQISYFESEATIFEKTDEWFETRINWCIAIAFTITIAYLVISLVLPQLLQLNLSAGKMSFLQQLESSVTRTGPLVATFFGALMPSIAAALSALRSHGEYAPIAARYLGTSNALCRLEQQVLRTLPDNRRNRPIKSASSAEVSAQIVAATSSLFQEVIGWQSVLKKKQIEPI